MTKNLMVGCIVLLGCSSCTPPTLEELNEKWGTIPITPTVVEFDPAAPTPVLPFPVDFAMFSGSADGTANIPVEDPNQWNGEVGLINGWNTLDGVSTLVPMTATFNGTVNASTVVAGDTIRLFEVTKSAPYLAMSGIVRELTRDEFSVQMTHRVVSIEAREKNGTLKKQSDGSPLMVDEVRDGFKIIPTTALKPNTAYLVVVGTGIVDSDGRNIEPDLIYGICKGSAPLVDRFGRTTVPIAMDDARAAQLEQLRILTNSHELLLGIQAGISSNSIALSWTFTTQSVLPVLKALAEDTTAGNVVVAPALDSMGQPITTEIIDSNLGGADIWVGVIEVPYYLDKENANSPTNFWKGLEGQFLTKHYYQLHGLGPAVVSTERIPFILTLPNSANMPSNGWPLTIFQHDITQNRTNALAIADSLAQAGRAVIAIDLPHHGIDQYSDYELGSGAPNTDSEVNPLFFLSADAPASFEICGSCNSSEAAPDSPTDGCESQCGEARCRVPAMGVYANASSLASMRDLVGERTHDINGDGYVEGSGLPLGTHFLNLNSGLNTRDNLRQAVTDLMVLRASIGEIAFLDATNVAFVGHGIGASVGVLFLSVARELGLSTSPSVLISPLSGIARSLSASVQLSPLLEAGLLAAGISKGTPQWDEFLWGWQTLLDSADPVNFGQMPLVPTLMMEMAGDGVLGNNGNTLWPTGYEELPWGSVGSSALASRMGLVPLSGETFNASGAKAIVRFATSDHLSVLDPGTLACESFRCEPDAYHTCRVPLAARTEAMQSQIATFIESGGTTVSLATYIVDDLGAESRFVCEPSGFECESDSDCCGRANCVDARCE